MKINIGKVTELEIISIINKLEKKGFNQVDEAYLEVECPIEIHPDAKNENYRNTLGVVLYPELLEYREDGEYVITPWICAKIELESLDENIEREIVKWLKSTLEETKLTPFKDEDSFAGCSTRHRGKGYSIIKLYINPDYPDGYWENHTL